MCSDHFVAAVLRSSVNDPDGSIGDPFSLALAARCQWALATCLHPHLTGDEEDAPRYRAAMKSAERLAREAAEAFPHAPCSKLLIDVPMLQDAFENHAALVLEELRARTERHERDIKREYEREEERRRVNALIESGDWKALGLPTPDELVAKLLAGEPDEICDHFVVYEKELDVVWFTNPYGVDGALCSQPNVATMTSFLIDMARGVEYGPIP